MSVSIVVASHGADRWRQLALSRALPSTEGQGAHEVLVEHDPDATRADVRNRLVGRASGEWIVTLDADDELAPGYVEAIERAAPDGDALLTPAVSYVHRGRTEAPRFWPEVDLYDGNWMVVGTAFPRRLFLEVGGWVTLTGTGVQNEWDDWHLWIRLVAAGAKIVRVPDAVYVAHVSPRSPSRSTPPRVRRAWMTEIRDLQWPPGVEA